MKISLKLKNLILILTVFTLLVPSTIFASTIDDSYINYASRWVNNSSVKSINFNNDDGVITQATAQYIFDETAKSAYFKITCTDSKISRSTDPDAITLTFKIHNSTNYYAFSVNKNGMVSASSDLTKSNITVHQNFVKTSNPVTLYVALGFNDSIDLNSTNKIAIDYSSGSKTYPVTSNVVFNLDKSTTAQTTAAKKTNSGSKTTQKASSNSNSKTSQKSVTTQSNKKTTQKFTSSTNKEESNSKTTTKKGESSKADSQTTKFTVTGSKYITSKNSKTKNDSKKTKTTKFNSGGVKTTYIENSTFKANKTTNTTTSSASEEEEAEDDYAIIDNSTSPATKTYMTSTAKKWLFSGIAILILGILFVLIGAFGGKFKIVKNPNNKTKDEKKDNSKK